MVGISKKKMFVDFITCFKIEGFVYPYRGDKLGDKMKQNWCVCVCALGIQIFIDLHFIGAYSRDTST